MDDRSKILSEASKKIFDQVFREMKEEGWEPPAEARDDENRLAGAVALEILRRAFPRFPPDEQRRFAKSMRSRTELEVLFDIAQKRSERQQ